MMKKEKPKHIGIIPDGNRRWALAKGMGKQEGYAYGLDPGIRLLRLAKAQGIEEISYYGFTMDNCKRPKEQVRAFREACVEAVDMLCGRLRGTDCSRVLPNVTMHWLMYMVLKVYRRNRRNSCLKRLNFLRRLTSQDIIYPASIVMPQRYTLTWAKRKKLPNY